MVKSIYDDQAHKPTPSLGTIGASLSTPAGHHPRAVQGSPPASPASPECPFTRLPFKSTSISLPLVAYSQMTMTKTYLL